MSTQEIILLMVNELCKNYFENAEYTDMDETMTSRQYVHDLYYEHPAFTGIREELEQAINRSNFQSEVQGFYLGFKEALRVFSEK